MENFSKFIFKKYIHGVARDDAVAKRDCDFPIGLSPSMGVLGTQLRPILWPDTFFCFPWAHAHLCIDVHTYTYT